ncbi:MAG: SLC13/DASS family transporter [Epsilonproteobacteria bacterium]|nr:SLC13/DASS family transporter [Campylobacterota bacterium]
MKKLSIAIGLGLLAYAFSSYAFNQIQAKLLGSVVFLVYLWSSEALPLGVVSLLPLILFPALGILSLKATAPAYSKPIIFLFIGGFLLAIALQKTKLHEIIASNLITLFPSGAVGTIYALAITSGTLSAFLSNTTVTIMLMPIALSLTQNPQLKVKYLLAVAYGASIGGIFTPIGTPPNLILLGFLEEIGTKAPGFLEWMGLTFPVVALMILIVPWILSRNTPQIPLSCKVQECFICTPQQGKLALLLMLLILLLVANAFLKPLYPKYAFNEKILLLAFGLALFFPKIEILDWEDTKELPYEIVFLFGAGFAIATAFIKTELALAIAQKLSFFANLPLVAILVLVALFVSFSTEITSNTALTSISLPIFYEFANSNSLSPEILLFTATISASYAFMLPIATPPNAIVMSSKVIKINQMAKIGFLINLIGVIIVSLTAILFWRFYFE